MDAQGVISDRSDAVVRFGVMPAAFYMVLFFALTWPALTRFTTHYFSDNSDGLQNIWNLWWIDRAVTELHQNPWRTTLLHYPYGTSLIGHTLNPFNGFVAIPFLRVLPLVVVHNGIVTFAFVAAGVTAFLLAYDLSRAWWPSLIAGGIFTFSSFHFAHAEGHLQLLSLEWIPLFVLLWLRTMSRPSAGLGAAAAAVLFLVLLCDFYYFFYCAIAALIILAAAARAPSRAPARKLMQALGAFLIVSAATSGVLAGSLLLSNARDPFSGSHVPAEFSLDVLSPFIYGAHWRFAEVTRPFWVRLRANAHESSVHLGFAVIALTMFVWLRRASLDKRAIDLFTGLLVVFLVLALGPTLQVGGREVIHQTGVMPYGWLQALLPFLKVSGVPVRMMVMVTLSVAVLSAFGFALLWQGSRRDRAAAITLGALVVVEYLPTPIPTVPIAPPGYVRALTALPGGDGVLDLVSSQEEALAYQTIHQKPLAFGYIARVPKSVADKDRELESLVRARRYDRLWPDYRLRYVVAGSDAARRLRGWPGVQTEWDDSAVAVFDVSHAERKSQP